MLILLILAVCVMYTANRIYKTYRKAKTCKDFKCANCPFLEKCEQKKRKSEGKPGENRGNLGEKKGKTIKNESFLKKVDEKFGGTK